MKPKFKNLQDWEKAQVLMQPSLIRVVDNIRKHLDRSSWKGTYEDVQEPFPGHLLRLTYEERSLTFNLWDLCFQTCFLNYPSPSHSQSDAEIEVDIDSHLFDPEGEVDWNILDDKVKQLIDAIFADLS
ncbi:MAG: hypothetical protein AAGA60_28530 [Cyanobacteria bacterium P01_E01_bin.42]